MRNLEVSGPSSNLNSLKSILMFILGRKTPLKTNFMVLSDNYRNIWTMNTETRNGKRKVSYLPKTLFWLLKSYQLLKKKPWIKTSLFLKTVFFVSWRKICLKLRSKLKHFIQKRVSSIYAEKFISSTRTLDSSDSRKIPKS